MEQIKTNILNISKKLIIAFIVLTMAGFFQLVKPADAYAGVLFKGTENGDPWHKYDKIDPQVRAEASANELPWKDCKEFGRTDTTRYKEDSTHWVQNICFEVGKGKWKDKDIDRRICVRTKDTDSGWFFMDYINWKYHVVVESHCGVEATFWVEGETCTDDHEVKHRAYVTPEDCESGDANIMDEILANPHMADCNRIKMYIDQVWIQD